MGSLEGNNNGSFNPNETRGKVITCKAAVVWGPKQPFVIEDIQVHPPQKLEVRIKILYTSICHTDLSAWKGESEAQRIYPRILGHEAVGIVESVGEGVNDMQEGDKVVPIFNGECQECIYCKSEKTNLCEKFRVNPFKSVMHSDGKTRFTTRDGSQPIYHFLNTSTFSEYSVMDSACLVKIDSDAPLKMMTLLSCGVSTERAEQLKRHDPPSFVSNNGLGCIPFVYWVGAAWNTAHVKEGSSLSIFGLGSVGLAVAEGARARGASRIIGVDTNQSKFIKGVSMGVTDFINPMDSDKPVHEIIREMTGGKGVDYSFECAGNLGVLREAFLSTHDGWGLTVVLGIHPTPNMMPLHPMELFDGRKIVASVFGDFKGKSQLPKFANDCISGVVKLDGFITHELPFLKINEAFDLLVKGESLRCLLQL